MNLQILREQIGSGYTNAVVQRLHRFAYVPPMVIEQLATEALTEQWGNDKHALKKYIAIHIAWSIEQGRVTFSDDQFYITAGHLQTRYGTPLYLVFTENIGEETPWRLITAGSQIRAPQLPQPPEIPNPSPINAGAEIVMLHDHILRDNQERVAFLRDAPPVAQMCAISGAIQWSLNRGLQLSYWYYGNMNILVPLYLRDRENITNAPDVIAPVQIAQEQLLVRTVLEPHMPYANARVSVKRHDQLPPWMISAWNEYAQTITNEAIDDPER